MLVIFLKFLIYFGAQTQARSILLNRYEVTYPAHETNDLNLQTEYNENTNVHHNEGIYTMDEYTGLLYNDLYDIEEFGPPYARDNIDAIIMALNRRGGKIDSRRIFEEPISSIELGGHTRFKIVSKKNKRKKSGKSKKKLQLKYSNEDGDNLFNDDNNYSLSQFQASKKTKKKNKKHRKVKIPEEISDIVNFDAKLSQEKEADLDSDEKGLVAQGNVVIDLSKVRKLVPSSEWDGRRRLQHFLPKRYHWTQEETKNLGYYWFNGPQGMYSGPKSLRPNSYD